MSFNFANKTFIAILALAIITAYTAECYSRELRRSTRDRKRYLVQSLSSIDKLNFDNLSCKGTYQPALLSQLDRICDDCYQLYKAPEIHFMCRSDCFTTPAFKGCLDALLFEDKEDHFNGMIKTLRG